MTEEQTAAILEFDDIQGPVLRTAIGEILHGREGVEVAGAH
jgi:hypothetical protein